MKMLRTLLGLLVLLAPITIRAQFSIDADGDTIDFAGLTEVAFTSGSGDDLDADWWSVDINGDGTIVSSLDVNNGTVSEKDFGDNQTSGTFFYMNALSTTQGTSGRMYVYNTGSGNLALGVHPDDNNQADKENPLPYLTLRIRNNSGSTFAELEISYKIYSRNQNAQTATFNFSHSQDNSSFTDESSVNFTTSASTSGNWVSEDTSLTITSLNIANGGDYYLRWKWGTATNDPQLAIAIDDIVVNGVSVDAAESSTLSAGATSEPSSFSSLTTYNIGAPAGQENSVINFDFVLLDDGTTPSDDNIDTKISAITIQQGSGNDISDWSQAIDTAILLDGTTDSVYATSITSNTIVFDTLSYETSGDLGFIADNGSKTYQLKIVLKQSLEGDLQETIEGSNFVFLVDNNSFSFLGASSGLIASQSVNSGSSNNAIEVLATQLSFDNVPNSVGTGVDFALSVKASDANGNADEDSTSTITLSLGSGTGALTAGSLSQSLVGGVASWSDLSYGTAEIFTIDASASGFSSINSGNILAAQAYRTVGSGSWTSTSIWEYNDGSGWNAATAYPDSDDGPITIQNGHTVTIGAIIVDQITIENGGVLTNTGGTMTLQDVASEDDLTIENGGELNINSGITLTGTIVVEKGGVLSTTSSDLEDDLAGSGSTNIDYQDSSIFDYRNTTQNNFGADTYFPNATSDVIPIFRISERAGTINNGTFVFNGILEYSNSGNTITFGNNTTVTFRNGITGDGNVTLNGTGTFSITGSTLYFGGSGTWDMGGHSLNLPSSSSIVLTSDRNIINGTLSVSSGSNLYMYGYQITDNTTNNLSFKLKSGATLITENATGISGAIDAGGGSNTFATDANYTFNGSSTQNTGFTTYAIADVGDLTLDNSSGLTLDNPVTISGTLTLTNGVLTTSSTNYPTFEGTSVISGGASTSFIDNKVGISNLASSYSFPLGDGSDYRPLTVQVSASSSFILEHTTGTPDHSTSLGSDLDTILQTRYWTINRSSGSGDITVTLNIDSENLDGLGSWRMATLQDGTTEWQSLGAVGDSTATEIEDVLSTISNGLDYDLTLGAAGSFSLPITLLNFTARSLGESVKLEWVVAEAVLFGYFDVQRSDRSGKFRSIGRLDYQGSFYGFTDNIETDGPVFYRLRLVDEDGSYEFSKVIRVESTGTLSIDDISVYPNPAAYSETIRIGTRLQDLESEMKIYELSGRLIHSELVTPHNGVFEIKSNSLKNSGVYIINLKVDEMILSERVFVR